MWPTISDFLCSMLIGLFLKLATQPIAPAESIPSPLALNSLTTARLKTTGRISGLADASKPSGIRVFAVELIEASEIPKPSNSSGLMILIFENTSTGLSMYLLTPQFEKNDIKLQMNDHQVGVCNRFREFPA